MVLVVTARRVLGAATGKQHHSISTGRVCRHRATMSFRHAFSAAARAGRQTASLHVRAFPNSGGALASGFATALPPAAGALRASRTFGFMHQPLVAFVPAHVPASPTRNRAWLGANAVGLGTAAAAGAAEDDHDADAHANRRSDGAGAGVPSPSANRKYRGSCSKCGKAGHYSSTCVCRCCCPATAALVARYVACTTTVTCTCACMHACAPACLPCGATCRFPWAVHPCRRLLLSPRCQPPRVPGSALRCVAHGVRCLAGWYRGRLVPVDVRVKVH